jgi:hypothetical protein
MIPPEPATDWSFAEANKWLARHPDALEPGLRFLDRGLELGHGLKVPLCAVDPLGHPCLVIHTEKFGVHFFDQLLEIAARMTADGARFQALFSRPTAPRVFLLAPSFETSVRQRLVLLARAFPLRAFLWLPPLSAETAPQLIAEPLAVDGEISTLVQSLPAALQPHAQRLLHACVALRPQISVQAGSWPIVLRGQQGPYATLFFDQGQLWFASSRQCKDAALFLLENDSAVDCAIDLLMRSQGDSVSPAA